MAKEPTKTEPAEKQKQPAAKSADPQSIVGLGAQDPYPTGSPWGQQKEGVPTNTPPEEAA